MKKEFLLETFRGQTRLAVIEDGALCELYYERPGEEKLSGNLYLGRVTNILPGMNAAFVDIGEEKNAFLHVRELLMDVQPSADSIKQVRIEKMLRQGQEILVQVSKEPGGTKGCCISGRVMIPGRATVLLPGMKSVGVSKKISDSAERDRLHAIASELVEESGMGVIVRTAGEGADAQMLKSDYRAACELWKIIETRARIATAPKKIYFDGSLALRMVRDLMDESVDAVRIDDEALLEEVQSAASILTPQLKDRIVRHAGETPLFDVYRVDVQADKRMGRHVWLKSGGSIVIDETEAMTVIDVNTGKFVGSQSLEETIFKLNCEAAEEIARLIRLRDVGGIIIIDFIDMSDSKHREALLERMRDRMAGDRNRTHVIGFTSLGLMEMTRKKVRQPLSKQLMHICSDCSGTGRVPSFGTTAWKIARELWVRGRRGNEGLLLVRAIKPVVAALDAIGAPEGVRAYVCADDALSADAYSISPIGERELPTGSKLLK